MQIRKSEKNLLERLFTVIHHLTPTQMEVSRVQGVCVRVCVCVCVCYVG